MRIPECVGRQTVIRLKGKALLCFEIADSRRGPSRDQFKTGQNGATVTEARAAYARG